MPTTAAPGWMSSNRSPSSENVFSWSGCWNDISPSKSVSWPSKWGICLRIRITPMAASNPLITLDGTKSAIDPARITPRTTCKTPARNTATRKASKGTEQDNLGGHDGRQPGSGTADAGVRPADRPDQDASDNAGQDAGEQRRVRKPAPRPGTTAARPETRPNRPTGRRPAWSDLPWWIAAWSPSEYQLASLMHFPRRRPSCVCSWRDRVRRVIN